MGKITINELSNSLLEYIENNTENKQDKTDSSLKTTDKTIVGAINELFQNANNGKSIIATAIGAPLTASQTWSTMGTNIDTMLATFKGHIEDTTFVTVNPDDKLDAMITHADNIFDSIGVLSDLETNAKDSIVAAVNEICHLRTFDETLGDLSKLLTNDKSSAINAIDEIRNGF